MGCIALAAALLLALPPAVHARRAGVQGDAELGQLQRDFQAAVDTFASLVDQPDSIPMFARLISVLQRRVAVTDADADRALLVASLSYRSQALFNNGSDDAAADDIRALLRLQPGVEVDRVQLSPRYLDLFDRIYDETIGFLELAVSPDGVEARLDGAVLEPGLYRHAAVAGTHVVSLERPGYRTVQREIELAAGGRELVEESLVRLSAVIRVVTRPAGARITVDGSALGATGGQAPADFVPPADAALFPRAEFSDELVVEGLQPGTHTMEVALEGYRTRRSSVDVEALADYRATVVLERAAGTVVLEGLEAGTEVEVDGVRATPQFPASGSPRLELEPGAHRIEVSRGTGGVFTTEVAVADQQTHVVAVRLLPGLAFLGVLGRDERGARDLTALLTSTLAGVEDWVLLDRSGSRSALEGLGLDAGTLRAAAATGIGGPDWRAVQAAADRGAPGSVYMLAVLDDDLLATRADLWIWPAAPGPARPDRVSVRLDGAADVLSLASAFSASAMLQGPWLGTLLTDIGGSATVTAVTAGGPAASAGLQVGDRLVSIGGTQVDRAATARGVVEATPPGASLALQVQRGAATQIVEVTLGTTPRVISPADPDLVYSVISASLGSEPAGRDGGAAAWVVRLNQAAVLLHAAAWEDAVRTLRGIEDAPAGAGVGQAAVDYWLGMALVGLGPSYRESAVQAFQRAAADPEGRLFNNDGPWVAPRAAARLAELGGS